MAVGLGKIILFASLIGDFNTVYDGIVAARVKTCEKAVPLTLDKFRLNSEFCGNCLSYLGIKPTSSPDSSW